MGEGVSDVVGCLLYKRRAVLFAALASCTAGQWRGEHGLDSIVAHWGLVQTVSCSFGLEGLCGREAVSRCGKYMSAWKHASGALPAEGGGRKAEGQAGVTLADGVTTPEKLS
jgi:hypothetical protein